MISEGKDEYGKRKPMGVRYVKSTGNPELDQINLKEKVGARMLTHIDGSS